ncbi:MAG: hypothetical protein QM756_04880 [Polyangiaceae bacterium]
MATCESGKCGAVCATGKKLCLGTCIGEAEACSGKCPDGTHECTGLCPSTMSVNACGTACTPCEVPTGALQATCDGKACGVQCAPGYHLCAGKCPADDDPKACGTQCEVCPTATNGSAVCLGGTCGIACKTGYHLCGDKCLSDTDPLSCGTACDPCTVPTGGAATCSAGKCGTTCPSGQKLCLSKCIANDAACDGKCPTDQHPCSGLCVANNNTNNCGTTSCTACPRPTGGTETCDGTSCGFKCGSGYHACGTGCSADDDATACGTTCTKCPTDANGTAICQSNACAIRCNTDYHLCSGKCVSNKALATCGTSCSACTAPTGGSVTCDGVACVPACPTGQKICSGVCVASNNACGMACPTGTHNCSGFCVSNTDLATCGSGCTACTAPASNGSATCSGTACGISCNTGYHVCGTSCSSNTSTNSCGTSCTACAAAPTNGTVTCTSGVCGFTCKAGFTGSTCQYPRLQASPLLNGYTKTYFRGLSGDGLTIAGVQDPDATFLPFRWIPPATTVTTFMTGFPLGVNGTGTLYAASDPNTGFPSRLSSTFVATSMPDPQNGTWSTALGMSWDGSIIVGSYHDSMGSHGMLWTPGNFTGTNILSGGFSELSFSSANLDGKLVVGTGWLSNGTTQAVWWSSGSGPVGLAGTNGSASWISKDGTVIVGAVGTTDLVATRWSGTAYTTRQSLTALPSTGSTSCTANATSQNGSVTVGYCYVSDAAIAATVWTGTTVQSLADILVASGTSTAGWSLDSALGVSDDGKVIAGNGSYNGAHRAWVARIP